MGADIHPRGESANPFFPVAHDHRQHAAVGDGHRASCATTQHGFAVSAHREKHVHGGRRPAETGAISPDELRHVRDVVRACRLPAHERRRVARQDHDGTGDRVGRRRHENDARPPLAVVHGQLEWPRLPDMSIDARRADERVVCRVTDQHRILQTPAPPAGKRDGVTAYRFRSRQPRRFAPQERTTSPCGGVGGSLAVLRTRLRGIRPGGRPPATRTGNERERHHRKQSSSAHGVWHACPQHEADPTTLLTNLP